MHRFGERAGWFALLLTFVSLIAASPASAAHAADSQHARAARNYTRAYRYSHGHARLGLHPTYGRYMSTWRPGHYFHHGSYSLVISPGKTAPVGSGQAVSIKATLTNESNTHTLGSANLFAPPSFKVLSASSPSGSASVAANCRVWKFSLPCVQLRGLGLAPHSSLTVSMTVQTPACKQGSGFIWFAQARATNGFWFDRFRRLYLDLAHSQLQTALDGACKLAFVTEPANSLLGGKITGEPDNPAGPPLTVEVLDSGGTVLPGSTAPVTMSLASNPGGATLGGTTTVDAASGTASFADLTLNVPGTGYELSASSGTLAPATSDQFDVAGQSTTCNAGQSCEVTSSNAGGSIQVLANASSETGQLSVSMEPELTGGECAGYNSLDANTYVYMTTVPRSTVATLTIVPQATLKLPPKKVLESQQICFGATQPFVTNQGTMAPSGTLPNGTDGFIGLLPDCTATTAGPCHDRSADTTINDESSPTGYDIVLVANVPPSFSEDPHMR